jgi:hypothetical protein
MGRSRFLHRGLTGLALAALLAACGGDSDSLLVAANIDPMYANAEGGAYGIKNADPAVRGAIQGRVTYTGTRKAQRIDMGGKPFCQSGHPDGLRYEDFQVGADNGLGGVYVYLKKGVNKRLWPVPSEPKVLDQVKCQYVPHILTLRVDQPLIVKSSDQEAHNVRSNPSLNQGFNQAMPGPGTLDPKTFSKAEIKLISCDAHTWMSAWVAISAHPCVAVTGADGGYRIEDVPPGDYQLAFWHEALGEFVVPETVTVGPNEEKKIDHVYEGKQ